MALGIQHGLVHRGLDVSGLSQAHTHPAFSVTRYDQDRVADPAATLGFFRNPVDLDNLLLKFLWSLRLVIVAIELFATAKCHMLKILDLPRGQNQLVT